MALASQGPIQMGRYRSRSRSRSSTTCWAESAWTWTLSTITSVTSDVMVASTSRSSVAASAPGVPSGARVA